MELEGEVEVLEPEQKVYQITPGTLYAPDKHDRHMLRAKPPLKLICVSSADISFSFRND